MEKAAKPRKASEGKLEPEPKSSIAVMSGMGPDQAAKFLGCERRQALSLSEEHKFRIEEVDPLTGTRRNPVDPVTHQRAVVIDRIKMAEWVRLGRPKHWPPSEETQALEAITAPASAAAAPARSQGAALELRPSGEMLALLRMLVERLAAPTPALPTDKPPKALLTAAEVEQELGLPQAELRWLTRRGAIAPIGVRRRGGLRWWREDVLALRGRRAEVASRAAG